MLSQEQLNEAKQQLAAAAGANGHAPAGWSPAAAAAPPPVTTASWAQPQPAAAAIPPIVGIGVPIKLNAPNGGTLRVDLMLPPEVAANPQVLQAAIAALAQAGFPLDVWQPKQNSWGGGGNRGGGGSGWGGGNRGGW